MARRLDAAGDGAAGGALPLPPEAFPEAGLETASEWLKGGGAGPAAGKADQLGASKTWDYILQDLEDTSSMLRTTRRHRQFEEGSQSSPASGGGGSPARPGAPPGPLSPTVAGPDQPTIPAAPEVPPLPFELPVAGPQGEEGRDAEAGEAGPEAAPEAAPPAAGAAPAAASGRPPPRTAAFRQEEEQEQLRKDIEVVDAAAGGAAFERPAGSSASVGVQTDEAAPAGGGGLSADALGALKEEMKAFIESKFDELARQAGGAAAAPGVGAPAAQVDVTFLRQTGIYMGVQQPTVSPRDRGSRLGPRSAVQSATRQLELRHEAGMPTLPKSWSDFSYEPLGKGSLEVPKGSLGVNLDQFLQTRGQPVLSPGADLLQSRFTASAGQLSVTSEAKRILQKVADRRSLPVHTLRSAAAGTPRGARHKQRMKELRRTIADLATHQSLDIPNVL